MQSNALKESLKFGLISFPISLLFMLLLMSFSNSDVCNEITSIQAQQSCNQFLYSFNIGVYFFPIFIYIITSSFLYILLKDDVPKKASQYKESGLQK